MATLLNPMRTDAIRRRAGWALRNVAPPKRLARATGKSLRLMQAWYSGERPSPAAICAELLVTLTAHGLDPWPVITFLRVEAMAEMLKVDGDKLTARLRAAMKEETAAQGDLDQLQMDYGLGATENPGFLRELADKAEAHARRCEEIAVYARLKARELEQRRAS